MMRRMGLILIGLLSTVMPAFAASSPAGVTAAWTEAPRTVQMSRIEGLPTEPPARAAFLEAFRAAVAEVEFPLVDGSARNRFRVLEEVEGEAHWSLQVVLGAPPVVMPAKPKAKKGAPPVRRNASTLGRATRGLTVVLLVLSPEARKADARPIPVRLGLVFPDPTAMDGVGARVASGGYEYPWGEAGRATGLLALELLHQRAGDLQESQRAFLGEGVQRAEVGR